MLPDAAPSWNELIWYATARPGVGPAGAGETDAEVEGELQNERDETTAGKITPIRNMETPRRNLCTLHGNGRHDGKLPPSDRFAEVRSNPAATACMATTYGVAASARRKAAVAAAGSGAEKIPARTAIPAAPASRQRRTCWGSRPPIAHSGVGLRVTPAARPSKPMGSFLPRFDGVSRTGPKKR